MLKKGVVLLSGGLDSTTVAGLAVRQGYDVTALTVHYGQTHGKEIQSAREVARLLGLRHQIIDVSFYKEIAWYSALTNPVKFNIPEERSDIIEFKNIPVTYVPLRNTFFLTMAAAYLESEVLNLIEQEKVPSGEIYAAIFIAANAVDYSGYPDCRPEFYKRVQRTLYLGSKIGVQYGVSFHIKTPIIRKSKAEIIKMAIKLGVPLEHTWSCYEGGEYPCGKCDSCILRAKGFAEAGYRDPLLVRLRATYATNDKNK